MANEYEEREDSEWTEVSRHWLEIKEKIELLQEQEKALKEQLIALAKEESSKGGGIRLLKSFRKGVVQYDQIPELEGVDLERYRAPAKESWTLMRASKSD